MRSRHFIFLGLAVGTVSNYYDVRCIEGQSMKVGFCFRIMSEKSRLWRAACAIAIQGFNEVIPFRGKILSKLHSSELLFAYMLYLEMVCQIIDSMSSENSIPKFKDGFFNAMLTECREMPVTVEKLHEVHENFLYSTGDNKPLSSTEIKLKDNSCYGKG